MSNNEKQVGADTVGVGAGGGTAAVFIANSFFDQGNLWQEGLIYFSPWITIITGGIWFFLKKMTMDWIDEKNAANVIAQARKRYQEAVSSHASNEHQGKLKRIVEELEELHMTKYKDKLKIIG